jgi:hypothetical protein
MARSQVSEVDDSLEREADHVADRVLGARRPSGGGDRGIEPAARSAAPRHGAATLPPSVERTLSRPGSALDHSVLADMEHQFGQDFSGVRIFTDPEAQRSARDVNARAYTVGNAVVFGAGWFTPHTAPGRRQLAHELSHVVQQSGGPPILQRDKDKPGGDKNVVKTVTIPPGTTSPQEFRRYAETVIFGRVMNFAWQPNSSLNSVYADISKHVGKPVKFTMPAAMLAKYPAPSPTEQRAAQKATAKEYQQLGDGEREGVNAEIDRRYYESVGATPGAKIKPGEKGKAAIWHSLQEQVLADRREIQALPDDIKKVLFAGGPDAPGIDPQDYTQILRIAHKLARLRPEQRADYLGRITADTTDLDVMERSVDNYLDFQAQRLKDVESHETAAKPLLGMDDVYTKYRFYKTYLKDASLGNDASEEDKALASAMKQAALNELLEALKKKNFDSVEAFEASIESYRVAFRTHAVNLALDVLARYDHMLFEERKKLSQPGATAAIAHGIAASGAKGHYEEAAQQKSTAENLWIAHEPKETWWQKPYREARSAEASARASGEAAVISGSGDDALVKERGTDREKLAGLNAAETHKYLFETLNKRAADVETARGEFRNDPDRVFKLPDLVSSTKLIHGVGDTTVYGRIIDDYISDERAKHLLSAIAQTILAIALALLVPGGGWVAAAAILGSAALSTYQAYTAYQEYEQQERDYTLHFLAEEPSLFWVGVAIAAAALDLGFAATTVMKRSANGLRALEGPMKQFAKDGDLVTLAAKIEAADASKALKIRLNEQAKAAKEAAQSAWRDVFAIGARTNAMFPGVVDPAILRPLFRALYNSVKRGVKTVTALAADAKFVGAVKELTGLSGAERAELETAFEEVKRLAEIGAGKNMDEGSLLNFIDRWATNRGKSGFQDKLLEEMNRWKPLTTEQQQAMSALTAQKRLVSGLYADKEQALEELGVLRAKADKTADDLKEIRDLEKRLTELDPRWDPNARVRPGQGKGQIHAAEVTLEAKEAEAARAELTLYDRLRAAAPGEAAKERALKGITADPLGVKTKPGGLEPDHVVSVREIADMDGFDKLPWRDQKTIADMDGLCPPDKFGNRSNLLAMDESANASKGARSWRSWPQASTFYDDATIEMMIKREAEIRAVIQQKIDARLIELKIEK